MEFKVFDLGLIDFKKAWNFQKEIFTQVKNNCLDSALILCQHYPVITLGRQSKRENILVREETLESKGIPIYEVERGGDVAYHGLGQLNVYPIFNLIYLKRDIHLFLRRLEEVVIGMLSDFGIVAERYPGLTGVWFNPVRSKALEATAPPSAGTSNGVNHQKIASIGIAIKNWITFHGVSINIKRNDLDNFGFIRPCGMDIEITSLETILNRNIDPEMIKKIFLKKFEYIFHGVGKYKTLPLDPSFKCIRRVYPAGLKE